ncbi:alpha/beta-Hydrolases superfamily protein [Actinidia rufa]|uniref:Alpha/beta-Hydrolases superfamily protein n=1 Tax=Actinidia rufa TaxID=165716 RepID=A0A7J0DNW4_9ERIC|nr:alpha/beta-Hydrolases superfamily protein [Actinidia rufa]
MYWTDLKDKVAGLALAQSPYGGSPIASDIPLETLKCKCIGSCEEMLRLRLMSGGTEVMVLLSVIYLFWPLVLLLLVSVTHGYGDAGVESGLINSQVFGADAGFHLLSDSLSGYLE